MTALHWAANNGQIDSMKFLIKNGANIHQLDIVINYF